MRRVILCFLTVFLSLPFLALAQGNPPQSTYNVTQLPLTGLANPANLSNPAGVALDGAGNLFIADSGNQRVIEVTAAGSVTVLAGLGNFYNGGPGPGFSGDGGLASNAQFNNPVAVALDSLGNVYVADSGNNRIRKFVPGGKITTVAGTSGPGGFSGDGGPATSAQLNNPTGIAVDSAGNLYISDSNNSRIRMVSAKDATISTVAGSNSPGFSGDGGAATSAQLFLPAGVVADTAGNIYVADGGHVRKFKVGGTILTVAGDGNCCNPNFGDGGPATAASINPSALAIDPAGNLYVADIGPHNAIRMVNGSNGYISTLVGQTAFLNNPRGIAVDANGRIAIGDTNNNRVLVGGPSAQILIASGTVVPGGTASIPLILNIAKGVQIDTLGLSINVYSSYGQPPALSFAPTKGVISAPPDVNQPTTSGSFNSYIFLAWSGDLADKNTPTAPEITGSVTLGTLSWTVPQNSVGNYYYVSINAVNADYTPVAGGTLTPVSISAPSFSLISVQNCTYLVGDTYPGNLAPAQCGQFGDNQFNTITFEDVIQTLRAWSAIATDASILTSDLGDAFDSFPTPAATNCVPNVGGDGTINLQDVLETMSRWANLDNSRETRQSGTYLQRATSCTSQSGQPAPSIASRGTATNSQPEEFQRAAAGTVELGAVQVQGNLMRAPIYVRAGGRRLTSLAFSIGWSVSTPAKLSFSKGSVGAPTIVDDKLPGVITAAWLEAIPAAVGRDVLLGYVQWDRSEGVAPAALKILKTEVNGE